MIPAAFFPERLATARRVLPEAVALDGVAVVVDPVGAGEPFFVAPDRGHRR